MIIVNPVKLRKYKKENKLYDNRLHKMARKKARKIASHFKLKLREEAIFNPYILDLYIDKIRVGIEIDGSIHNKTQNYDNRRDSYLSKQYGIMVLRFTPDEIKNGLFKKVIWECCYSWFIKYIKQINKMATQSGMQNIIPKVLQNVE